MKVDTNADNPRIQMWNAFIADAPAKTAEKYRAMQKRLCEYSRSRNQQFSENGAAELIVAVAERLGEVRNGMD